MVEPVGREYTRRLPADDARDALYEASLQDGSSSFECAARLDDWIQNGFASSSEPRYPAALFANASVAARPDRATQSAERAVASSAEADNLIRGLAGARHTASADEFHRFVSKNAPALSELLRPYGYQGCRLTAQASIEDFDRAYSSWSARNAAKVGQPMSSVGLSPKQTPVEDPAARQHMWRTAATDPIAAAFIGAGAIASATVGQLFGFEQDPHRATAGARMTSIFAHVAGGAGANCVTDNEPAPIELQRSGPRPAWGASSPLVLRGGLEAHEALGGHVLAKHVGIPKFALEVRLHAEPRLKYASTFESRAEAETAISSVMAQRSADIQAWVASGAKGTEPFDGGFTGGFILVRGASETIVGSRARVVLRGDGRGDFFILTGYVLP